MLHLNPTPITIRRLKMDRQRQNQDRTVPLARHRDTEREQQEQHMARNPSMYTRPNPHDMCEHRLIHLVGRTPHVVLRRHGMLLHPSTPTQVDKKRLNCLRRARRPFRTIIITLLRRRFSRLKMQELASHPEESWTRPRLSCPTPRVGPCHVDRPTFFTVTWSSGRARTGKFASPHEVKPRVVDLANERNLRASA